MKVAIISDIHDNVWKLKAVLDTVKNADKLICCGDLCSPFIIDLMAVYFSKQIHIVFGNNDGDQYRITQNAARYKDEKGNNRVMLYGQFYSGTIDNRKIAVNHYPDIALPIAESAAYDLVCYGHNHLVNKEMKGRTLFVNPGTIMGYNPVANQDVPVTFAVYDTGSGDIQLYELTSGTDSGSAHTRSL